MSWPPTYGVTIDCICDNKISGTVETAKTFTFVCSACDRKWSGQLACFLHLSPAPAPEKSLKK